MSDIANPRIEGYYLHPKKYAWRGDNRSLSSEQKVPESEENKDTPIIGENFKMAILSNFNMESDLQNGIPHAVKPQTPTKNHSPKLVSQDAPLDFSVKTIDCSIHPQDLKLKISLSNSSVHENRKIPHDFEYPSFSNDKKPESDPIYNIKISSSRVPIYNGNSKFQRKKQKSLNGSPPTSHPSTSQQSIQSPTYAMFTSRHHDLLQNSNHQRQHRTTDERSFDSDRPSTPTSSPRLSSENNSDNGHYSGSILQEALVTRPGEKSHIPEENSYLQKLNTSTPCTKSLQEQLTPPFMETNSFPSSNLMLPGTHSFLSTTGTLIPGPNSLVPRPVYPFVNGLFPPTAINGINAFGNGSLLSPTMDSRITQSPAGDKKQNKTVRPFKALSNELLYGIPATMGLPSMPHVAYFKEFYHGPTKDSTDPSKSSPVIKKESPETSANRAINSKPSCSNNGTETKPDAGGSDDSISSNPDASTSITETTEVTSNNRKRSRTLPEELKDDAYWERRRKNNQAAKRSRDARRQKEDMVAQQAWLYRDQFYHLQYQNGAKDEQLQLRDAQLRAATEQIRNLELQLRFRDDKIACFRCENCGLKMESNKNENGLGVSSKN